MRLDNSRRLLSGTLRMAPKNGNEMTLTFVGLFDEVLQISVLRATEVGICTHEGRLAVGVVGEVASPAGGCIKSAELSERKDGHYQLWVGIRRCWEEYACERKSLDRIWVNASRLSAWILISEKTETFPGGR
jgi:hypothetical protein